MKAAIMWNTEYPKILTVFKRDPATKHKTLLHGEFATPELEYLANNQWTFTEKVDGTNVRVAFKSRSKEINYPGIRFYGRTDNAQLPQPLFLTLKEHFESRLHIFEELWPDSTVCLYGEGYGAKIQKGGGNYRPDQAFVLFDIKVDSWWLRQEDVIDVAQKLELDVVPIITFGTLYEMASLVQSGFKSNWGDFLAEGIVAQPIVQLFARDGSRIMTKVKHKDFA